MRALVVEYSEREMAHYCIVYGESNRRLIDIMIDGGLGEVVPRDLIGKTVTFRTETPYITIANDVEGAA